MPIIAEADTGLGLPALLACISAGATAAVTGIVGVIKANNDSKKQSAEFSLTMLRTFNEAMAERDASYLDAIKTMQRENQEQLKRITERTTGVLSQVTGRLVKMSDSIEGLTEAVGKLQARIDRRDQGVKSNDPDA